MLRKGFWSTLFAPVTGTSGKDKFSAEELRNLYDVLQRNQVVTDNNRAVVVETIRSVAEFMIWGDQNEPKVFDFFLEHNVLLYLHGVLQQPHNRTGEVAKQVLQTLSIIIQNVRSETGIFFLFSNNHINAIVEVDFDFEDEEVLGYYISFLKTISLKLNKRTVQFFFDTRGGGTVFPLYAEAVKFAHHKEGMVRAGVRTLTLNVYCVDDPYIQQYITSPAGSPYFDALCIYVAEQFRILDRRMAAAEGYVPQLLSSLDSQIAEVEDMLSYLSDILGTGAPQLAHIVSQRLWVTLVGPYWLQPLMLYHSSGGAASEEPTAAAVMAANAGGGQAHATPIRAVCALYILERVFSMFTYQPLLHNLLLALVGTADAPTQSPAQQRQEHDAGRKDEMGTVMGSNTLLPGSKQPADTIHNRDNDRASLRVAHLPLQQALSGLLETSDHRTASAALRLLVAVVQNRSIAPELLQTVGLLPRTRLSDLSDVCLAGACAACSVRSQLCSDGGLPTKSDPLHPNAAATPAAILASEPSDQVFRSASMAAAAQEHLQQVLLQQPPVLAEAGGYTFSYRLHWSFLHAAASGLNSNTASVNFSALPGQQLLQSPSQQLSQQQRNPAGPLQQRLPKLQQFLVHEMQSHNAKAQLQEDLRISSHAGSPPATPAPTAAIANGSPSDHDAAKGPASLPPPAAQSAPRPASSVMDVPPGAPAHVSPAQPMTAAAQAPATSTPAPSPPADSLLALSAAHVQTVTAALGVPSGAGPHPLHATSVSDTDAGEPASKASVLSESRAETAAPAVDSTFSASAAMDTPESVSATVAATAMVDDLLGFAMETASARHSHVGESAMEAVLPADAAPDAHVSGDASELHAAAALTVPDLTDLLSGPPQQPPVTDAADRPADPVAALLESLPSLPPIPAADDNQLGMPPPPPSAPPPPAPSPTPPCEARASLDLLQLDDSIKNLPGPLSEQQQSAAPTQPVLHNLISTDGLDAPTPYTVASAVDALQPTVLQPTPTTPQAVAVAPAALNMAAATVAHTGSSTDGASAVEQVHTFEQPPLDPISDLHAAVAPAEGLMDHPLMASHKHGTPFGSSGSILTAAPAHMDDNGAVAAAGDNITDESAQYTMLHPLQPVELLQIDVLPARSPRPPGEVAALLTTSDEHGPALDETFAGGLEATAEQAAVAVAPLPCNVHPPLTSPVLQPQLNDALFAMLLLPLLPITSLWNLAYLLQQLQPRALPQANPAGAGGSSPPNVHASTPATAAGNEATTAADSVCEPNSSTVTAAANSRLAGWACGLDPMHRDLLGSVLQAAGSAVVQDLGNMWCESVFPLICAEWPQAYEGILRPTLRPSAEGLMSGPHLYPKARGKYNAGVAQQKPELGLSNSAISALHTYHNVQRLVSLLQLQRTLKDGTPSREAPLLQPPGCELRPDDINEGQQVDLQPGCAIPCIVSFAPGQERRVHFAAGGPALSQLQAYARDHASLVDPALQAALLHSSPAVVLADPAPTRLNTGIVLSVSPLLGCDPAIDRSVAKWLHVHVRPSVRGLLRVLKAVTSRKSGLLAAMRQLADGHWVLSFPDAERAAAAKSLVEAHSHKLRALYVELLAPLLEGDGAGHGLVHT